MPKNKKLIIKKQESSLKSADDGDTLSEFEYDGSSDNNSDAELRDELAAQNEENEENQEIEETEEVIAVPKRDKKNTNKIADSDESDEDGNEEETETEADVDADAEDTDINENDDDNSITNDEECLYRNVSKKNKKKDANIEDDDSQDSLPDDDIDIVYDDDNIQYNEVVKSNERITKPFLTTFERVRLICDRAKQLSLGAKPMIKMIGSDKPKNPKEIAKLELESGVMPLIVERVLPNGKKEQWKVSELKIIT